MEDVRAAALGERGPLLDAEAVLLVDDRDGEVGELDLALDQRVGADRDPDVPRGDELVCGARSRAVRLEVSSATRDAELARRAARS